MYIFYSLYRASLVVYEASCWTVAGCLRPPRPSGPRPATTAPGRPGPSSPGREDTLPWVTPPCSMSIRGAEDVHTDVIVPNDVIVYNDVIVPNDSGGGVTSV